MNPHVEFFVAQFRELLDRPEVPGSSSRPRPYRNAAVRFRSCRIDDFAERIRILLETGMNVFKFPAQAIPGCDLLSDSGTTTMTMEQWSQMLLGDEAYGSNEGFFELREQIARTFGPEWGAPAHGPANLFLFHQGRAAEHALFSILARTAARNGVPNLDESPLSARLEGHARETTVRRIEQLLAGSNCRKSDIRLLVPSNSFFDTTEANAEANRIVPLNLPCAEHLAVREDFGFRGNMDTAALTQLLDQEKRRIPLVYLTVTNNTGGGQPVAMANIRAIRQLTAQHRIPFLLDACRFAENAWFIKQREPGYAEKSVSEIVHEMFSLVDGFHISFKKDGLANIGGALVIRTSGLVTQDHCDLLGALTDHQILCEGHPTYGGLAGRDLKAITEGLRTVTDERYLDFRTAQTARFGARLDQLGIPVIKPFGGHAIYIDVDRFFAGVPGARDDRFPGIALTALLLIAGHRLCELGVYAFGKYRDGAEIPPEPRVNNVRAAIPRLAYEDQDLAAAAETIAVLHRHRDRIPGVAVLTDRDLPLRHFKSDFAFLD
jgi:tryptophanase